MTEISGPRLTQLLWERNGSTYTRGPEKLTYDGYSWWWKGKQVKYLEELPENLISFPHLSIPNLPNTDK